MKRKENSVTIVFLQAVVILHERFLLLRARWGLCTQFLCYEEFTTVIDLWSLWKTKLSRWLPLRVATIN